MKVGDLSTEELSSRLAGDGVVWRVGPFAIRLRGDLPRVLEHVRFFYSRFPLAEGEIVDFDLRVRYRTPLKRWICVEIDGRVRYDGYRERILAPALEWAFNLAQFCCPSRNLMLHSAVVESGGKAAIMPGESGAGKSTLCAALSLSGWRLFSDESAILDSTSSLAWPAPRPIALKEQSIAAIRSRFPKAELGPMWKGTPKGVLAHLRPSADSIERHQAPATPAWIVFPRFRPGASSELRPISKGRTLLRAAQNAFNYSSRGRHAFSCLADVVDTCDCYELEYCELDAAVASFNRLCGKRAAAIAPAPELSSPSQENASADLIPSVE